jgi:1-acyl-sn-glycerol-3-phosphate acyltransferase
MRIAAVVRARFRRATELMRHGDSRRMAGHWRQSLASFIAIGRPIGTLCNWIVVWFCRALLRLRADCRVEGIEHVPASGPVVLASRHVHHALDGAMLLAVTPRRLHPMVAIDWAHSGPPRWIIDRACRLLAWPTVLRPGHPGATDADEAARMLRRATREAIALLRDGRALLVFPEGYPNIDPHWTPKPNLEAWLPFDAGFAHLARLAQRNGAPATPVVPVGFHYRRGRRWRIVARFGAPRVLSPDADLALFVADIEASVRALSVP